MDPSPEQTLEMELLARIGKRDRASFEQLYDRLSAVLFSIAYRVLNDQAAAEDVLQDVFIQIWDKASRYDPARGKPLTWAVTLTRNKSIDRLRSAQRRHRLQDEMEREQSVHEATGGRGFLDAVEAGEKNESVRQAVRQLSDAQREAIEMAFFRGLTQAEIAQQLDEPLGTVKARIRRGMMKLRELLGTREN